MTYHVKLEHGQKRTEGVAQRCFEGQQQLGFEGCCFMPKSFVTSSFAAHDTATLSHWLELVMLRVSEGGVCGNDPGGSDNKETAGGSNQGEAGGEELWDALTMARWAVQKEGYWWI